MSKYSRVYLLLQGALIVFFILWQTLLVVLMIDGHPNYQKNILVFLAVVSAILVLTILSTLIYLLRKTHKIGNELSQTKDKARLIIEQSFDPYVGFDENDVIIEWNPKAEATFGWSRSEIVGKKLTETIFPAEYRRIHLNDMKRFLATGKTETFSKHLEIFVFKKDGMKIPIEFITSPIKIDGSYIFSTIIVDITERRKIEDIKNQFISVVNHEIRTPLTSIQGSLMLLTEKNSQLDEQSKNLLVIAKSNTERLVGLINDILDINKIATDKIDFYWRKVEINSLVLEAIHRNQLNADKHKIKFEFSPFLSGVIVRADDDKLGRVLDNLLSNAIKFSPDGGKVEVTVRVKDNNVRVAVKDRGIGIAEEFKNQIFHKFAQADSSSRRQLGGAGLGLSITQAIIIKLGGKIDFESDPKNGTTFYFELPVLNKLEKPVEDDGTKLRGNAMNIKVLYVEDDHDLLEIVGELLKPVVHFTGVCTEEEARKKLQEIDYDLIIVDLKLSEGYCLNFIKDLYHHDMPVIIYSAYELPLEYEKYVYKSLMKSKTTHDELLSAVQAAIQVKKPVELELN